MSRGERLLGDWETEAWQTENANVAWGRTESDSCELGTRGCCIRHVDKDAPACQPW